MLRIFCCLIGRHLVRSFLSLCFASACCPAFFLLLLLLLLVAGLSALETRSSSRVGGRERRLNGSVIREVPLKFAKLGYADGTVKKRTRQRPNDDRLPIGGRKPSAWIAHPASRLAAHLQKHQQRRQRMDHSHGGRHCAGHNRQRRNRLPRIYNTHESRWPRSFSRASIFPFDFPYLPPCGVFFCSHFLTVLARMPGRLEILTVSNWDWKCSRVFEDRKNRGHFTLDARTVMPWHEKIPCYMIQSLAYASYYGW